MGYESSESAGDDVSGNKSGDVAMMEERVLLHVYIPVQCRGLRAFTRRLMGLARLQLVNNNVKASFCEHDSFHISISRPVSVPESKSSLIVNRLQGQFTTRKQCTVTIEQRVIALRSKNTRRLFVAAPIQTECAERELMTMVRLVDDVYRGLGLPAFYDDPRLHMSFASTETTDIEGCYVETPNSSSLQGFQVDMSSVVCEVGRSQFIIPLDKS